VRILVFLAAAAVLSGVLALVGGEGLWEVHIAFDASLALYVALLLETKRRRAERAVKVRSLAGSRARRRRAAGEGPADALEAYGGRRV
jgi:hypothetical protein